MRPSSYVVRAVDFVVPIAVLVLISSILAGLGTANTDYPWVLDLCRSSYGFKQPLNLEALPHALLLVLFLF
jgi:hypothetical protein